MIRRRTLARCTTLLALAAACPAWGGDLEPPGAPAPTMKTLAEVEPRSPIASLPFTITQSGAYYLASSLTGSSGQHGITIAASGVSLDLMGFTLLGVEGSLDAIRTDGTDRNGIIVRNGMVLGWGGAGLSLTKTGSPVVERLTVTGCGSDGVVVTSPSSSDSTGSTLIRGVLVTRNAGYGLNLGNVSHSLVMDSVASVNTLGGIRVARGHLLRCTVDDNLARGIEGIGVVNVESCRLLGNDGDGIRISRGSVVRTHVVASGGYGIDVELSSLVQDNVVTDNGLAGTAAGIRARGADNRIEGNHVVGNDIGIQTDGAGAGRNVVVRNTAACNGASGASNYQTDADDDRGSIGTAASGTLSAWGNISLTAGCP
jgi:hypothetical protein